MDTSPGRLVGKSGKKGRLMQAPAPRFPPWHSCQFPDKIAHFGKNHTLTCAPCFVLFLASAVEKCSQRVALVAHFALLCTFLPGSGLAVLLFGGFWQLERNVIYTQMFCTHLSESEAGSQIPRDGWIEGRFLANQCTSLWESKPIHQSLSCERKLFAKEADSDFQQ